MLGDLRRFGIPEYVTPQFIAKKYGKPANSFIEAGLFDELPYIVKANGLKLYKYNRVVGKLSSYGINEPNRTHPNAKIRPDEIIADLDVGTSVYLSLVKRGLIVEQPADEYGKYVFYKDYDHFIRNYVPSKMVNYLPSKMTIKDSAEFIGIKPGSLRDKIRKGEANCVWYIRSDGKRRFKWMTREQIIQYINYRIDHCEQKAKMLIRRTPITDRLTTNLCMTYMKMKLVDLKVMLYSRALTPDKELVQHRMRNFYNKAQADVAYMTRWMKLDYGDYMPYYTRNNIKNKFGKTDLWIDTYVKNTCRTMEGKKYAPKTKEERDQYAKKHRQVAATYIGWFKEDVDAVIASGVEIDPVFELKHIKDKYLDMTKKRELRAQRKQMAKYRQRTVRHEPIADEIEASIMAAMEKKRLEREDAIDNAKQKMLENEDKKNQLRRVLGIKEKTNIHTSGIRILKFAEDPQIVSIVYSRNAVPIYVKNTPNAKGCIFHAKDAPIYTKGSRKKAHFSVFENIARCSRKIMKIPPKVSPSWIVLAAGTSYVNDVCFYDKLKAVPPEYGAVSAFGYGYTLPNGSWMNCPDTYGMYSMYSMIDPSKSKRVVGTKSCVGTHEIAVMDGPFIAIRGGYLPLLNNLKNFSILGDGRSYVAYAMSMIFTRMKVKMLQVEVDSAMSAEFDIDPDGLEWNKVEDLLIQFSKKLDSVECNL